MSRSLQNRAKRAHDPLQVTKNGKARATLRQLSYTVLRSILINEKIGEVRLYRCYAQF